MPFGFAEVYTMMGEQRKVSSPAVHRARASLAEAVVTKSRGHADEDKAEYADAIRFLAPNERRPREIGGETAFGALIRLAARFEPEKV